jgi:hypothetical protein
VFDTDWKAGAVGVCDHVILSGERTNG